MLFKKGVVEACVGLGAVVLVFGAVLVGGWMKQPLKSVIGRDVNAETLKRDATGWDINSRSAGGGPDSDYAHDPGSRVSVVTAKKISGAESALDAAVGSEANGMNHNSGVVVGDVEKESDAYRAGLRAGDRLTAVNGEHVSSWTELQIEFLLAGRSGPVSLNVMRDDTVMKMKIPLSNNNALGLWILEGVHPEAQTIVSEVLEGSPANAAGIKVGDALYSMNGIPILWPDYFIKLVTANGGKRIDLVVLRGGQKTNISIQPRFDEVHKRHVIGIKLELRK